MARLPFQRHGAFNAGLTLDRASLSVLQIDTAICHIRTLTERSALKRVPCIETSKHEPNSAIRSVIGKKLQV